MSVAHVRRDTGTQSASHRQQESVAESTKPVNLSAFSKLEIHSSSERAKSSSSWYSDKNPPQPTTYGNKRDSRSLAVAVVPLQGQRQCFDNEDSLLGGGDNVDSHLTNPRCPERQGICLRGTTVHGLFTLGDGIVRLLTSTCATRT